jgi:hypothetical protein
VDRREAAAWCARCETVRDVALPWRWHKVVARTVYVLAGGIVVAAPWMAFDYCVMMPFAMSVLIAVGPARRLAAEKATCRTCGLKIDPDTASRDLIRARTLALH